MLLLSMSSISSDMWLYVIKLQHIHLRYSTGNRVLVTVSNLLTPNVFNFSAARIPTQPTPQMQHIRNQDTYTYHKWYTLLNSPCAAEAINNSAPMGGGPRPGSEVCLCVPEVLFSVRLQTF